MAKRRRVKSQPEIAPASSRTAYAWSALVLSKLTEYSRAIAVALVLIASVRIVSTYHVFNHTSDEPVHIACGIEWLGKGTYSWEPQHPPLSRIAAAVGPYLSGLRPPRLPTTGTVRLIEFAAGMLYGGGHYDRRLTLARCGILPFFWIACVVVYVWGRRYFDPAVAAVSVFLFSLLPPILAHAGLATTDMPLTAFLGASFLSGLIFMEEPTARHALIFGACTGLCVLAKLSSLVFLPAAAAVAIVWYLASTRPTALSLIHTVRQRAPLLGLALVVCAFVIWSGYRFSFGELGFVNLRLPAPEFFQGMRDVALHNRLGHMSYVLGRRSLDGFWYFFEVALAFKTPIAFLVLAAIGTAVARPIRFGWHAGRLPLAFIAGILLTGIFSRINIGLRHVLPVYIGLSILAALGLLRLLELSATKVWTLPLSALLLLWLGGASALSHPDYLAYFNEFAGSHPEDILVDSDLDWGQDLKRLSARLHELNATEVAFYNVIVADLRLHGFPPLRKFDVTNPQPGWNAIGAYSWKARRTGLDNNYPDIVPWPDRVAPTERVGKSIFLWYFPPEVRR